MNAWEAAQRSLRGSTRNPDNGLAGVLDPAGVRAPMAPRTDRGLPPIKPRFPGANKLPPSPLESQLSEREIAIADVTGQRVAQALRNSPGTPVRLPTHNCPPVRAVDFDAPLQVSAAAGFTIAAGATQTIVDLTLNPNYYGVLLGIAWTIVWTSGAATPDPYFTAAVTLKINGNNHPVYFNVNRQLTTSVMFLVPVTIPIAPINSPSGGAKITIDVTNNHGLNSIDAQGRIKGYQVPVGASYEGIEAGLVGG